MKDIRETVVYELECMLLNKLPDIMLDEISNALLIVLDKYELQDRCTELVVATPDNEEYIKLYLANCAVEGKREKTLYYYRYELTKFNNVIHKSFTEVTTYDVKKYLALILQRCSKRTAENIRSCLAPFFKWLKCENVICDNPMEYIKPVKFPKEKETDFSDSELALMRDSIDNIRNRAIFEFLLATGVRVSELCNLKRNNINMFAHTIYVKDGKGGKDRTAFISDVAITYLRAYLNTRIDNEEALFLGKRGETLNPNGVRYLLNTIGKKAGVMNVHPHRFRHTFASVKAKSGMPIQSIQLLLGHKNIETTNEYIFTSLEQVKMQYLQTA